MNKPWTVPEHLETLRTLVPTKMSYTEIAAELTKLYSVRFSRNSVLSKATRERIRDQHPNIAPGKPSQSCTRRVQVRRVKVARTSSMPAPPIIQVPVLVGGDEHNVRLADAEKYQCRWPVGGAGVNLTVCGRHVDHGSYCEFHKRTSKQ